MVKDPTDPEGLKMKKQIWVPGRGKGWVDEDKYNGAKGEGQKSENAGKIMIYPPNYFGGEARGEGHAEENEGAMLGVGGNLFNFKARIGACKN